MQTPHWVHLDLKGLLPSEPRLMQWLDRLAAYGFDGIVFEYEDRLPWESWPGTFRPGYSIEAWRRVWGHCKRSGLTVVPLVQTFGHLEWLLKHDRYAELREAGHWNLLCPNHPQVPALLERWLDEILRLHPDSPYVHVGLDEVFNLASCPRCRAEAEASGDGKLAVYLHHASRICEHVLRRGVQPIIWGDMFVHGGRIDLANELPQGTVLCDWQYGAGPFDSLSRFSTTSHPLMCASAIRCGFDPSHDLLAPLGPRIHNVVGWHQVLKQHPELNVSAIIHTTWGRSRSLMPIYGPWEGWLPVFAKAARPDAPLSDAMTRGLQIVDEAANSRQLGILRDAMGKLRELKSDDPFEQQALRWWQIALRHRHELWWTTEALVITDQQLLAVRDHIGLDPAIAQLKRDERAGVLKALDEIEQDIRRFWADNQLSDLDEFIASRITSIRRALSVAPAR